MNFLSHYYFDKKEPNNGLYHLGLMFPDFLKQFTLQRFKPINKLDKHPLFQGALKHVERDEHFHSHPFFDKMCKDIAALIDQTEAKSIPKTWFLAHILLEMGIDRIIMEENIKELDTFYAELSSVTKNDIDRYFNHNNLAQTDVFYTKLSKFNESKWLYQYLEDEKLPISLNHVYFRIGLGDKWNSKTNSALVETLPEILNVIKKELPSYS